MSGPVFRDYNWNDLLRRVDPDMDKPVVAYQFGNGRVFLESKAGPYSPTSASVTWTRTGSAVVDVAIVDDAIVDHP